MKPTAFIIGSGVFGCLAAGRLKEKFGVTLVDPDRAALDRAAVPGINRVCRDGIKFLAEQLETAPDQTWIVPCLPKHLAWEFCRQQAGHDRLILQEPPQQLERLLPNPVRGEKGHLYTSHADFLCPDNCCEPAGHCTVTQKERKENMFSLIDSVSISGCTPLVIQSRQLAPGVGGYLRADLLELCTKVCSCHGRILVATACRCHGVVTFCQVQRVPK